MINENVERFVIVIAVLCSFSVAFTSNALSVALPSIAFDFGISNITQNWVVNIYLLVIAACSVPAGKICGKYGLNRTMQFGLVIYIIGAVLSVFSVDIVMLFVSRILHGIGSSILFVNVMAIITEEIPRSVRGRAIGFNITGVYLGLTLAPTISGVLVENFSWRSIFIVTLPLIVVSIVLLYIMDREWFVDRDKSIDVAGSLLFILSVMILMYAFTILNTSLGVILCVVSVAMLLVFAYYELNVDNPVYDVGLFRNSRYSSSNIASFISYFATFVVTYILNYHFQYIKGLSPQSTGLILIVTPLLMAVISPFSGRLSDKIDPQILAATGMTLVSIALVMLSFIDANTSTNYIIVAMLLQGVGFGIFSSPNTNIIMSSVPAKDITIASASISTVRTVGQSFSLGLLTLIFALVMGNVTIEASNYPALVTSSQITMTISTILCVIAIALSLIGIKLNKSK